MPAKELIKKILRKFGYRITRAAAVERGFRAPHLARICQPKTVIDAGVGYGTPELYKAFPTAKFILVEPLREYASALDEIAKRYDCVIYRKAVGETEGAREIAMDTRRLEGSSFKERSPLTRTSYTPEKRQVEVTTLDAIFREHPELELPVLLKIDTVGYELEVLRGAGELLQATDTVILGISIAPRFVDGYGFEDVVRFMENSGFHVYDFLRVAYMGKEVRPRFADVIFKRG